MAKVKIVSLVEAVDLLNKAYDNDPAKSGRDVISKKTLYNAISARKLKRHGRYSFAQVEVDQLLQVFGPKKAS